MDMLNNSLEQFSAKLASAAPTPGGGGAAALAGALAVALGNMVGSLTVGKKKYADVEDRIKELNAASEELRGKLLAQMDEDAKAFEPLSKAYGIPKDAPGRDEELERCLHAAAEPPMNILRLSCPVKRWTSSPSTRKKAAVSSSPTPVVPPLWLRPPSAPRPSTWPSTPVS